MHELAVCQALLTEVERAAAGSRAGPAIRIVLRLGPLCGVEPRLLARAFEFARVGGVAAEAELCIEPTAVQVECALCQRVSDAAPNRLICGHCGAWHTRLVTGDELLLQRVEFRAAAAPAVTAAA
jgi:hydrogenase nickel incorporation protein HypA/HybF